MIEREFILTEFQQNVDKSLTLEYGEPFLRILTSCLIAQNQNLQSSNEQSTYV